MPEVPVVYLNVLLKLAMSLLVVGVAWIAYRVSSGVIKRQVKDTTHMHTMRMLLRNGFLFVGSVIVLMIWLGVGSNLTVAMGILGAGIAFASQEVIGSFAGYLNIVSGSIYRIGDRVSIGNVAGDVMDISILRTTVMEIGEWVKADQYTGRIVTIANRAVFADPVYNYTQHWGYIWDEITVPITYASDWRRAVEIMLQHGQQYTEELHADAEARLGRMIDRYPVQRTQVEPTTYLTMTDNWIEITLRYVVDARERRTITGQLHRELLQHFETEEKITVASMTVEIVGFPALGSDTGQPSL
jgi:small-conductance mechanosensitive channel